MGGVPALFWIVRMGCAGRLGSGWEVRGVLGDAHPKWTAETTETSFKSSLRGGERRNIKSHCKIPPLCKRGVVT